MVALGTPAPDFTLPDVRGGSVSLTDFAGKPVLVAFICNHCPYVKHIIDRFAELAPIYRQKGVEVVAISSNDTSAQPEDTPEKMAALAEDKGFVFPYLYDEDQSVAKSYGAVCTPDFFLYGADRKLYYRGEFDSATPGNDEPVTGESMSAAVDALAGGNDAPADQHPSRGCNIKWKPGNEPGFTTIG